MQSEESSNLDAGISAHEISVQTNGEFAEWQLNSSADFLITLGDDDSHSESTSGCSSLLPHPDHHRRENHDVDLHTVTEHLNMDQSSLAVLGNSLSKSLAADLKNSRGRKTLSLHNFSANDDVRLEKESG